MPWHTSVSSIAGHTLADVLFGYVNPAGKLPITLPVREEDIPAHLNYGSENGKVHYREDWFVGYKWHQSRAIRPLYPFGFGLSCTTFSFSSLELTPLTSGGTFSLGVALNVTSTGKVPGSEVVQEYVTLPAGGPTTPKCQLRAFKKVKLDTYAVSFWDINRTGVWRARKGVYGIAVGSSSVHHQLSGVFEIKD
ncbi:hypothetical protein JB92DRAFT_3081948 [Gautieria morchelliformis]|nr:hypothetical protein JB92DRAFT_3081948 [Gautieria morchelliformis]